MTMELSMMHNLEGVDRGECVICGSDFWVEFEYQEIGVCHGCSKRIAHALVMAHGGAPDPRFSPIAELVEYHSRTPKGKERIPSRLRKAVFERDAYRCRNCGDHHDLQADHIYPESKGGETVLENLQTLCRPCNIAKGARVEEPDDEQ